MCELHSSVKRKIIDLEKCTEIYIYFYIYFAVCVNWARSVSVFVIRSESQLRKIAVFVAQVAVQCEFQREISEAVDWGETVSQKSPPHHTVVVKVSSDSFF